MTRLRASLLFQFSLVCFFLIAAVLTRPNPVLAQGKAQKISKNLVKKAEKTVQEIEKTQKQLDVTIKKYNEIFGKTKVKDRQKSFNQLNGEIKNTEDRVKEVRKKSEDMQKEADKFFNEWSKGLNKIEDQQLRGLSMTNLNDSRGAYGEIIESGLKAGTLYESFLADLKNQSSYFSLDMSDTAMANLQPNKDETNAKAKALFGSINELTRATKSYMTSLK